MMKLNASDALLPAMPFNGDADGLHGALQPRTALSRYEKLMAVRRALQARRQRGQYFNCGLFSDPAWDILLELYAAATSQRRLAVTRICERTRTAMTTALRWIGALEQEGLVRREPNPLDGRQVFIVLTNKAIHTMDTYLDDLPPEGLVF